AAPTAAAPPPAEPAPLDEAAVQKLRRNWKEFLTAVRTECGFRLEAAMKDVRDIAIGPNTVAFAFGDRKFSRDMAAQPDMLTKLAAVLGHLLGRPITLECQLGEQAALPNMVTVTPLLAAHEGVDPLVAYAVAELRAEVVK